MGILALLQSLALPMILAAISVDDARVIAQSGHPAPNGRWEVVRQQFWPQHVLVRLESTSFPGWHHQPTVAVDAAGIPTTVTEGVLRLPHEKVIDAFNEVAKSERVSLDESNYRDYAEFFLHVHLQRADDICVVAPGTDIGPCVRPTFAFSMAGKHALVEADVVHCLARWRRPYAFWLERDGTVSLVQNSRQ